MTDPKTLVAQAEALEAIASDIAYTPKTAATEDGFRHAHCMVETKARDLRAQASALAAAQPGQGEREAFEVWASREGLDLSKFGIFNYANNRTDGAWHGWQAARAQPPAQPEGQVLDVAHEVGAGPLIVNMGALEQAVNEYVDNYEMTDGEVSHIPDENERALILDAIHGLLVDEAFDNAFGPVKKIDHSTPETARDSTGLGINVKSAPTLSGEWRLLPKTPTDEMLFAMASAIPSCHPAHCDNGAELIRSTEEPRYRAMLSAAPQAPGADKGGADTVEYAAMLKLLETIDDIWHDGRENPPETRCYVDGALAEYMAEISVILKAIKVRIDATINRGEEAGYETNTGHI